MGGQPLGHVYLVGAGPGDPGLLTLRGAECLRQADVVVYDKLVNRRLLDHAPHAEHVCVDDLPAPHCERHPHVHRVLIEAAQQGRTVVRLKGGDPLVFGRGGEEVLALRTAGIPYEIVPGVTAALAAGAYAGIPLTHRGLSSAVAFVTGHEYPGKSGSLDWAALARFPGTLAVYMGITRLGAIVQALMEHGKPPETPVVVVHWASTGSQRTVEGTLADIVSRVKEAHVTAPAVTIIGSVTQLRRDLQWFEERPLFGRSVLVTRPRHQAEGIVRQLESLGATVFSMPVIEIGPPPDLAALDRAIQNLANYDWLVFTSANGVHNFIHRLREIGRDLRALGPIRLAAIGPRTAEALESFHLRPDFVPADYRSESLAAGLASQVAGRRVLLARADRGRELLREELARIAQVDEVAVYSQRDLTEVDPEILRLLREGKIEFVTFTSSNIVRAFVKLLDDECRRRLGRETKLVTISPVTSAVVRELGFEVAGDAAEYTAEGLVQALVSLATHHSLEVS